MTTIETFIKRGMPAHVPSCIDAQGDATCPEHCSRCAFGTQTDDASRAAACTAEHSMRCVECANVHSLGPDIDVLCESSAAMLKRAKTAADDSADAEGTGGAGEEGGDAAPGTPKQQRVHKLEASFKELQTLLQRALAKFRAFHAHERRAAHEAKVLEMLLRDLKEDGCIIVADWKVPANPPAMLHRLPCYSACHIGQAAIVGWCNRHGRGVTISM